MPNVPDIVLDRILALQFTIAWAGEGRSEPRRLSWWDTDLVDEAGGGDFFARLVPRTHAWAALEAVREAARRVDAKTRAKLADPDGVRSLFFLGFDLDEQLGDRLNAWKRLENSSPASLPLPLDVTAPFSKDKLVVALTSTGKENYTVTPVGRQLAGPMPEDPAVVVQKLASALVPLVDHYPLPFYALEP